MGAYFKRDAKPQDGGGAAPGGPTAEEWRVIRETPNRLRGATVSVYCRTPCVFGFNTGPPGDRVSGANRSLRSEHAAVRRGVDGVEME